MSKKYYRIKEVSHRISFGKTKIYEFLKQGILVGYNPEPGKKGTRVTAESVESFLQNYPTQTRDKK